MPRTPFPAALVLAATVAVTVAPAATAAADGTADPTHHLVITVTDAGEGADGRYELVCDATPRGDHPDPAAACEAVEANAAALSPVSAEALCTYQHGGPATAQVEGVWAGRPVSTTFSRANGCEIDRWDRMVPALPRVGG
jgi:hypothetical protein